MNCSVDKIDIRQSGADIIADIKSGAISCEEICQASLERIAKHDEKINAWAHVAGEKALEQAERLDTGSREEPICGLTVGIKDVLDSSDMPTEYGSPIYRNHRPVADAACITALKKAGAVILGKTVTTEFAYNNPAKTVNPLDPTRTPGGSSSGSAAAVADGMALAAIGTQTVGSIIRPASYCGVVGYKPSFNLINRAGLKFCSESLDTIGVISQTVPDAGLVTSIMAERPELAEPGTVDNPPRIGFCKTHEWDHAEAATREALISAVELFQGAGASVQEIDLPDNFRDIVDSHLKVMATETRRALGYELAHFNDQISEKMKEVLKLADIGTSREYDPALQYLEACRQYAKQSLFSDIDIILAPSVPGEAPRDLSRTGSPIFNFVWTALHLPCLTVPGIKGPAGMPVGVQLVGPYSQDRKLLCLGRWAQEILNP